MRINNVETVSSVSPSAAVANSKSENVVKFNGTRIQNVHHLAHLIDCELFYLLYLLSISYTVCLRVAPLLFSCLACEDRYLRFEFEDSYVAVLEREAIAAASSSILRDYGIPYERSSDLSKPYVDTLECDQPADQEFGDSPVSNFEIGPDGLLWA
ncbi:hypothetical protein VNO78_20792 [Psophocarpus tetragonolobus]|uniref:Protease Do-like PDZ domain-containing protein n=1 Tax=Psophocarpus tetragonolobus TaxID=3891 RepID=A0AAN9SB11_PSOTE